MEEYDNDTIILITGRAADKISRKRGNLQDKFFHKHAGRV